MVLVLATALMALVVTTPIAAALFAGYVVLWVAGSLVAVAALAARLRRRFAALRRAATGVYVLSVLAAVLVPWIAALLPFVGALLVLLAFVTGIGGLILVAAPLYKQPLTDQT